MLQGNKKFIVSDWKCPKCRRLMDWNSNYIERTVSVADGLLIIADEKPCRNHELLERARDWNLISRMDEIITDKAKAKGYLEVKDERQCT